MGICRQESSGSSGWASRLTGSDAAASDDVASRITTPSGKAGTVHGDDLARLHRGPGDRSRVDSWLAVDLGGTRTVDRLTLRWEAAAGRAYTVQGSADGQEWTDLASWPVPDVTSRGGRLDVDGRAGFVVRSSAHPVAVYGDTIVLGDGPAAPLLVEALPGAFAETLRELSASDVPQFRDDALRAALTEDHLSLFNLSDQRVTTRVDIPSGALPHPPLRSRQTLTAHGSSFEAELDAATAALLPPRVTLHPLDGGRLPAGLLA
ncbi:MULTISPECIES: discoidin domain-containing protein [Streptomyces]|uniref:F5/8 type C domain-containing protein n=1 Tax=Streptomyces canarius TaxID=285453 RepID=A0ABQ3DA43_9ACTN|nr:discoidin domain-containing protein [Streptomyces canarius]GHA68731.1 hypothetical protein GCM10010345_85450 [Streptomyces canarius]